MSIATEIIRLQNDSAAIASAIAAKGVTIPSGSGFDDYAGLIATIPTGGGGGDPELPTGYTRKAYIYGDGQAYIETDITGNCNVVLTVQVDAGQTGPKHICGFNTTTGNFFALLSNGKLGIGTGNTTTYADTITVTDKINVSLQFANQRVSGAVNQYGLYRNGTVSRADVKLKLLCTTANNSIAAKLWSADVWQGTEHVFHGIPCLNPNNVAGMYDTISGTFYASDGAHDFTAGN